MESEYDTGKTNFLIEGFTNGFSIGYEGPRDRCDFSDNIPLSIGTELDIWEKIMKKVKLKRFAGPFKKPPFKNFIQSPISVVAKDGGKQTRLIFHLSYDFGPLEHQKLVNYFTPDDICSVKYKDLDTAVNYCLRLINEGVVTSQGLFYSKSDLKSAFCLVPCEPQDFCLLLLKTTHPVMKETVYYCDKDLPFGSSISCSLFQSFTDALQHLTQHLIGRKFSTVNYLDDYLFISETEATCNAMVRTFLDLCQDIGCPVSMEKTEWATQVITFLGIQLHGQKFMLVIPTNKKYKAQNLLKWVIAKKKVTVHTTRER